MTALPTSSSASNARWMLLLPLVSAVLLVVWWFTPLRTASSGGSPRRAAEVAPVGKAGTIYTSALKGTVLFQREIDRLPESPLMLRVTELEMEPGARIFEHQQLGPGAHIMLKGSITVSDSASGGSETHSAGSVYYEGMDPLHSATNAASDANHILLVELLPRSRGFDGNQQFIASGKHNEGEIRSGPFVQMPLDRLPEGPLMFRVTDIAFGPKAKSDEHTRLGPTLFYVTQGLATVRREASLQISTYGTNGYFFETGLDPIVLENKPASTARILMAEVLPASLGDGPSTLLTGN